MKKYAILSLCLVAVAGIAYAGATKYDMSVSTSDAEFADATGFAVVNIIEKKDVAILQIQCWDLVPGDYVVKSGGIVLGEFSTNKRGHGHVNMKATASLLGDYVNVWFGTDRVLRAELD